MCFARGLNLESALELGVMIVVRTYPEGEINPCLQRLTNEKKASEQDFKFLYDL